MLWKNNFNNEKRKNKTELSISVMLSRIRENLLTLIGRGPPHMCPCGHCSDVEPLLLEAMLERLEKDDIISFYNRQNI